MTWAKLWINIFQVRATWFIYFFVLFLFFQNLDNELIKPLSNGSPGHLQSPCFHIIFISVTQHAPYMALPMISVLHSHILWPCYCGWYLHRDHSGFGLSQWKTSLQFNINSHSLSPYPEWSMHHILGSPRDLCSLLVPRASVTTPSRHGQWQCRWYGCPSRQPIIQTIADRKPCNYILAPVPLSILRSNSKFDENSKHSSVKYTRPITTIFCTRHDSVTVVTCAKYRCDRSSTFETRAFWIFIEFRIRSKYP